MVPRNRFYKALKCILTSVILLVAITDAIAANELGAAQKAVRLQQYEQAFTLYQKAADAGNPEAQFQLANLYLQGRGTAKDKAKAKHWFDLAAQQSHAGAQFNLAQLLAKSDPAQSRSLLEASAAQGYRSAKIQLDQAPKTAKVNPNAPFEKQWFGAARNNDIPLLKALASQPDAVKTIDGAGRTALFYTVEAGHVEATKWLLGEGANVNASDKFGSTALQTSVEREDTTLMHVLLDAGADKSVTLSNGDNLIHFALRRKRYEHAKLLIDAGVAINQKNKDGWTPLDLAKYQKANQSVALLTQKGAVHGSGWGAKRKPQDLAAVEKQLENDKLPPLARAIVNDNLALVASILSKTPFLVNAPLEDGTTPLVLAVKHGNLKMIRSLLDQGAQINQVSYRGVNAVQVGAQVGDSKVLQLLLDAGGSPVQPDDQGQDAISTSLDQENKAITAQLLEHLLGDIDSGDAPEGQVDNYILLATQHRDHDALERLLPFATTNAAKDAQDRNALWYAADEGNDKLIPAMLKAKIPANQADKDGRTPMLMAVTRGCLKCAQQLLPFSKIDHKSSSGNTALMIAAANGDVPMVTWLIQSKAGIELRNQRGDTALMLAVNANAIEVVKRLLAANASVTRKNKLGFSSIDLAQEVSPQMLELVKSKSVLGIF